MGVNKCQPQFSILSTGYFFLKKTFSFGNKKYSNSCGVGQSLISNKLDSSVVRGNLHTYPKCPAWDFILFPYKRVIAIYSYRKKKLKCCLWRHCWSRKTNCKKDAICLCIQSTEFFHSFQCTSFCHPSQLIICILKSLSQYSLTVWLRSIAGHYIRNNALILMADLFSINRYPIITEEIPIPLFRKASWFAGNEMSPGSILNPGAVLEIQRRKEDKAQFLHWKI